MELPAYREYTGQLITSLETDARVIGLVALGSMAEVGRVQDAWSDHDFFVIVETGTQEDFRQNLNWLPYHERIVYSIRETAHGLKVIYDFPHLIEFAIFDMQELAIAKVNDYAILLDKGEVTSAIEHISDTTPPQRKADYDPERDLAMVLALIYVAYGRYRRGEVLSAHIFMKHHLLHHLIPLLIHKHEGDISVLDNLDPFRRFEQVFPELGAKLNDIMLLPLPEYGSAVIDWLVDGPNALADVVRRYISPTR